jgi:SAM-dependent methyltransferase
MAIQDTNRRLDDYFSDKLQTFGPTPKGVDYSGADAQRIRFEQLVKVIDSSRPFSVLDYGCGYGALLEFLNEQKLSFDYCGFDRIESMVEVAASRHGSAPNVRFTSRKNELQGVDYLVAGAIFNIKLDAAVESWQAFVLHTLNDMNDYCRRGFSFNMLTSYSDPDRMAERPDLFFGDPLFFFDYCKRSFSRNVALLHDYELYDFTILVRK